MTTACGPSISSPPLPLLLFKDHADDHVDYTRDDSPFRSSTRRERDAEQQRIIKERCSQFQRDGYATFIRLVPLYNDPARCRAAGTTDGADHTPDLDRVLDHFERGSTLAEALTTLTAAPTGTEAAAEFAAQMRKVGGHSDWGPAAPPESPTQSA